MVTYPFTNSAPLLPWLRDDRLPGDGVDGLQPWLPRVAALRQGRPQLLLSREGCNN